MAEIESEEVTVVLSQVLIRFQAEHLVSSIPTHRYQVLADLVQGEFQQLETKEDEGQVSLLYISPFFRGLYFYSYILYLRHISLNMLF